MNNNCRMDNTAACSPVFRLSADNRIARIESTGIARAGQTSFRWLHGWCYPHCYCISGSEVLPFYNLILLTLNAMVFRLTFKSLTTSHGHFQAWYARSMVSGTNNIATNPNPRNLKAIKRPMTFAKPDNMDALKNGTS